MIKITIAALLLTISYATNAADLAGLFRARIDSFTCLINQDNRPELVMTSQLMQNFKMMKDYQTFTYQLGGEFCYDLSSFDHYLKANNNEILVWLQTYHTQFYKKDSNDRCAKYIDEKIYIAIYNGNQKDKTTKSLPLYAGSSIFIENVEDKFCYQEPANDL